MALRRGSWNFQKLATSVRAGSTGPSGQAARTAHHSANHGPLSLSFGLAGRNAVLRQFSTTPASVVSSILKVVVALTLLNFDIVLCFLGLYTTTCINSVNKIGGAMLVLPRPMCPRWKILGCCIPLDKVSLGYFVTDRTIPSLHKFRFD